MNNYKNYVTVLVIALIICVIGFCLHLVDAEIIQPYVVKYMQINNIEVSPSWDVKYLAVITSVEVGIGIVVAYALMVSFLPGKNVLIRGFIFGIILLLIQGRLFRQPLMDYAVGNPYCIVMLQNGFSWLIWLLMAMLAAVLYEKLVLVDN